MGTRRRKKSDLPVAAALADALRENPQRSKILHLLTNRPGLNRNQICKSIQISLSATKFHVDRLEEAGLIEIRPRGPGDEMLCFTKENIHLWDDESTRILFGRGPARQVALYVAENHGASTKEMAKALDVSIDTVRSHLRILEEHNLIQRVRIEHKVFYHPAPHLEVWTREVAAACTRKWRTDLIDPE